MSSNPNLLVLIVGAVFTGLGAALIALWLRIHRQTRAARQWPSTQGVIIGGDLRTLISPQAYVLSQGGLHPRAEPRIEYEYQVDGQPYRSDKVRLGTWSINVREAARVAQAYAPGTVVLVFYDPQQPARAILQLPGGSSWGGIVVGLACVTMGLALMAVR